MLPIFCALKFGLPLSACLKDAVISHRRSRLLWRFPFPILTVKRETETFAKCCQRAWSWYFNYRWRCLKGWMSILDEHGKVHLCFFNCYFHIYFSKELFMFYSNSRLHYIDGPKLQERDLTWKLYVQNVDYTCRNTFNAVHFTCVWLRGGNTGLFWVTPHWGTTETRMLRR